MESPSVTLAPNYLQCKIPQWLLLPIITIATCHKLADNIEDIEITSNVTILYPIANKTNKHSSTTNNTTKHDSTTWKIETTFAESKVEEKEGNRTTEEGKNEIENHLDFDKRVNDTENNGVEEKDEDSKEHGSAEKPANYSKKIKPSESNEFKPSPHLGDYYDTIDSIEEVAPTYKTYGSFTPSVRNPAKGFSSSPQDHHASFKNIPKQIYTTHQEFPYAFDGNTYIKPKESWRPPEGLDSKPTAAVPVRVPAGGFYKSPDAFKDKPSYYGEDEQFPLDQHGYGNDNPIKKQTNPWKSLLRLVTAFIPVGLIISALTPNVITLQSTGLANSYPPNLYRRSDEGPQYAPISERCRRRLLCELYAEKNYINSPSSPHYGNQCYKLRCEDTSVLYTMLRWLFAYHQAPADQRGRHDT